MISGRAGAIAALIVLRTLLDDPELLEMAARFGWELIECAAHDGETYSWELPGIKSYRNLTGFSHGTAGAAACASCRRASTRREWPACWKRVARAVLSGWVADRILRPLS